MRDRQKPPSESATWSERLALTPAVALVTCFVAAPLLLLTRLSLFAPPAGRGFFRPGTWSLQAYSFILDGHGMSILMFTVMFAAVVTVMTLSVAYPLALFVSSLSKRSQVLALVLILMPKSAGLLAMMFGLQRLLPRGFCGAAIAEMSLIVPYSVLVLVVQLNSIGRQAADAGAGLGASPWQVFRRITLPLSMPGLVVAGQLSLIWGLGGFLGPLFLGGPEETTLSVELYRQAFDYSRWPRSAAQAVVLMGTTMFAVWLCRFVRLFPWPETQFGHSFTTTAGPATAGGYGKQQFFRRRRTIARAICWGTVCLLFLPVMYAGLVSFSPDRLFSPPLTNWSLRWYRDFLQEPRWVSAAVRSAGVATVAAIISVTAAIPAAWRLARQNGSCRNRRGDWLFRFILLPACVPAAALGAGLLPLMSVFGLSGSLTGVVLVHAAIGLPMAFLIVRSQISDLILQLCTSAQGLGASRAQAIQRVAVPLLSPALAVAMMAVFVISLNESVISVFLATPECETLPAVVWPQLRFSASPLVAVASCVTAVIGSAAMFAILRTMRRPLPSGHSTQSDAA